jgi:hypothetical protein
MKVELINQQWIIIQQQRVAQVKEEQLLNQLN